MFSKPGLIFLFLFISGLAWAQDIEELRKRKPFHVSGGLNANATYYTANSYNDRDPFVWLLNGNLNLSIYGVVNVPLSFLISKDNNSFDANKDALKRFGISPKYKSVTLHAGYRNLNFSQFTMSGITFLGGGIEYQPVNSFIKAKAFYGRFTSAHQYRASSIYDTELDNLPEFKRNGYGTMFTLGKKGQFIDLTLFKGWDDKNSATIPDSIQIKPVENFVVGISTRNSITDRLHVKIDYALSAFTTDTRQPETEQKVYTYSNNLGFLFTPRTSSQFNKTVQVAAEYNFDIVNLGFSYRRIDPQYQSLGISFINNDIEEFSANIAGSVFKNRMSFSGNLGTQRNNLDNSLVTTNKRLITSLNTTWLVTQKLNLTASYSNFNSSAMPTRVQLVDSVKYSQATTNLSLMTNYNFGNSDNQQGISMVASYQKGNSLNQNGTQVTDISNTYICANLLYRRGIIPASVTMTLSLNYSVFNSANIETSSLGPVLGISKSLLKRKLNLMLNTGILNSKSVSGNSTIQNIRFSTDYNISSHHSFRMSINFLNELSGANRRRQFQGNIAYNYIL